MGEKYADKQEVPLIGLERYPGQNERYDSFPKGAKVETGFGCNRADANRGFCEVSGQESPERDLTNYKDRWTKPRLSDEDTPFGMNMPEDLEFRQKSRETKGMFMRPRIPTER